MWTPPFVFFTTFQNAKGRNNIHNRDHIYLFPLRSNSYRIMRFKYIKCASFKPAEQLEDR